MHRMQWSVHPGSRRITYSSVHAETDCYGYFLQTPCCYILYHNIYTVFINRIRGGNVNKTRKKSPFSEKEQKNWRTKAEGRKNRLPVRVRGNNMSYLISYCTKDYEIAMYSNCYLIFRKMFIPHRKKMSKLELNPAILFFYADA